MAIELNDTILPASDPLASARFLAGILGLEVSGKGGRRGTYFRDPDGHLMEIMTDVSGEPA